MAEHPSLPVAREISLGLTPTPDQRAETERNVTAILRILGDTSAAMRMSVLNSTLLTLALQHACPLCFIQDTMQTLGQSITFMGVQPAGHA